MVYGMRSLEAVLNFSGQVWAARLMHAIAPIIVAVVVGSLVYIIFHHVTQGEDIAKAMGKYLVTVFLLLMIFMPAGPAPGPVESFEGREGGGSDTTSTATISAVMGGGSANTLIVQRWLGWAFDEIVYGSIKATGLQNQKTNYFLNAFAAEKAWINLKGLSF